MRGVEAWTDDLGRSLHEHGARVTVYKGGGIPLARYEKTILCIRRHSKLSQWIISHRPGFMWHLGLGNGYSLEQMTFCWALLPQLIFRQYDIIHTQDPNSALFCERFSRIGLIRSKVILAHGTEEPAHFLANFRCLQHLAPFHQEESVAAGVRNEKSFIIGNFVDTEVFRPGLASDLRYELHIPEDAFVLLSVAAIKKSHKRLDHLIQETAALDSANVYLVIAGGREGETEELIREGKEALGNRLIFLIDFPHERIPLLYAIANLFVLCSLKEMMPIALLEAMASGLPCLIHRYPVEEWMLGDGGESLDMSQTGELANVIRKYQDVAYCKEKSRKARGHVLRHFSRDVIVEQVLQMYEELVCSG